MKTTLKDEIEISAARMKAVQNHAFKRPIASILSICVLGICATTMTSFSQTSEIAASGSTKLAPAVRERILTANDGNSIHFRLIERTAVSIIALRTSDGKRFVIPLSSLIESDQKFLATWTPPPSELVPSSVSISASSTLNRGAYPSKFQPRYSGGGSGGYGGGHTTTRTSGGCRYIGSRTVVTPNCPGRK